MLYMLKGIVEVPNNYYRMKENVAFIWMHEICRTVLDRFTDASERLELYERTKEIGMRVFAVEGRTFVDAKYIDELCFCYGNGEALYHETPEEKKLELMLTDIVLDYNKANPREELDIIIFNTVIEKTLKINRSIRQTSANTILIANEGSGALELVKMAIRLANALDYDLHSKSTESKDDWKLSLKQMMATVGAESKQRACLHIQERDLGSIETLRALNALAAHGELFSYFSKEEMEQLVQASKLNFGGSKAKEQTHSQVQEDIRQKLKEDLHVLVQLNPRSDILLSDLRDANHLVNTSTIIWFGEWSNSGYEQVAFKHLVVPENGKELLADEEDLAAAPI